MTQTEETFQVALDILKNVPFYDAFLISAEIDVYTFRKILDLTPNVENQDFIQPPSSDDIKELLLNLGYTGKLPSISEIRVDHMHQLWRTFGAIINKCLSVNLQERRITLSQKSRGRAVKEDLLEEPTMSKHKPSKQKQVLHVESSDSAGEPAKVTQATKEPAAPKKATSSSKKKITKRKLVLKDETDMTEEEVEHRPLSRKKRVPKTVVIQEPPSAPVKQTYESSGKHKGIEMLSDVGQLEINTLKAQKASRRESRLQHHTGGSSEGTGGKQGDPDELTRKYAISDEGYGIQSKGPDETKNLSESDDDSNKWGSINKEVFYIVTRDENPKNPPSDTVDQNESEESEDDQNESEDDNDERVETDNDRDDKEEKDDRSTYIEETDTKRTYSDVEHQGKGNADMNIEQEVEKEMSEEKPEGDAQATEAQPNDDNKDKFEFLQPTSSQSLSSGFANQFLLNSPNASLLGTITEPAEVSVIPEATQAPPPPAAIVTLATQVPNTKAVSSVVQRFSEMEQFVKQLKETDFSSVIHDSITSQVPSIVDKYVGSSLSNAFRKEPQANNTTFKKELSELNYKEVIEESVKAHVVTEVKNFLPQFLPKAVSDFATPIIKESVKAHAVNEDV
ncbi:hypothetical protein Tco_1261826 [Tanacetum coccineum]